MHRNQRNEAGKLFIGGLSWDTNQDSLLSYFSQFGEVIDCVVMKNQQTGKSRGFGFVTFKDPQCVGTVLSAGAHILDGRQVDAKACNPKGLNRGQRQGGEGGRGGGRGDSDPSKDFKIFMGGLPNVDEEYLQNFFGRYGKVVEVNIMKDPSNKKSRGFGFLTFESEDSVEQVCAEHFININGKKVECKRATPRDGRGQRDQPPPFMHHGGPGGPMGRGPPPDMMGGPPPHQDWNQGPGNWNQGPPPPHMEGGPPGPPPNNFPPGQGYQPPPVYQQAPQQQPPPQQPPFNPNFQGQPNYQGQPPYQQGNWQAQPVPPPGPPNPQPINSPPAEVAGYSYGQHPPQTAYSQQPSVSSYGQYATAPAPQPAAVPAQPPAQPAYTGYGQPPTAAPANPAYATPGLPVADPSQPAAQPPPAAPTAYGGYAYSSPTPAVPTGVPDPYAQTPAQPNAQPGYGGVPQASGAPPTDPAAAQPKPADYAAYGYGAYGYGDQAAAVAPQPAPAYPGQGDAQLPGAYQAQPGGGYQRASVPTAQPYHPYRR